MNQYFTHIPNVPERFALPYQNNFSSILKEVFIQIDIESIVPGLVRFRLSSGPAVKEARRSNCSLKLPTCPPGMDSFLGLAGDAAGAAAAGGAGWASDSDVNLSAVDDTDRGFGSSAWKKKLKKRVIDKLMVVSLWVTGVPIVKSIIYHVLNNHYQHKSFFFKIFSIQGPHSK